MNRTAIFVAASLLAAAPAMAQTAAPAAQQQPQKPKPAPSPDNIPDERAAGGHEKINFLDSYDINADASVSAAEFATQRDKDFRRIDTHNNHAVTGAEYVGEFAARLDRQLKAERAAQIKQAEVRVGVLDTNKDGKISAEEFKASGNKLWAAMDSNHDGVVDEQDRAEAF